MNRRRFLATSSLLALSGCLWNKQTTRSQLPESDEADMSVGDVSVFDNAAGIPLSGVGLGDILPLLPMGRALIMIEEFTGVMYIALAVSRLVGLAVATRATR